MYPKPTKQQNKHHTWSHTRAATSRLGQLLLLGLAWLVGPGSQPAHAKNKAKTEITVIKTKPKARPVLKPRKDELWRLLNKKKYFSAAKEDKSCQPKCLKYTNRCIRKQKICTYFNKGKICREFKRFCLSWKLKCLKRKNGTCLKEKRICAKPSGLICVGYKKSDCHTEKEQCIKSARVCANRVLSCCWSHCKKPGWLCLERQKYCKNILPRYCKSWKKVCVKRGSYCKKTAGGACVQYGSTCKKYDRICASPKAKECPKHKPWCKCISWIKPCTSQALACKTRHRTCANQPIKQTALMTPRR